MSNYEINISVCITLLVIFASVLAYLGDIISAIAILLCAVAILVLELINTK